jgi:hypothetical protein
MSNFFYYLWLFLLLIYIVSPFDAHPLFLDDLIASGVLFYLLYKNAKLKRQKQRYSSFSYEKSQHNTRSKSRGSLTLDEAYSLLGVDPDAPPQKVKKAYKEKIAGSHPDKVNHLSKELQDKAQEITMRLNQAFDIIKRHRNF